MLIALLCAVTVAGCGGDGGGGGGEWDGGGEAVRTGSAPSATSATIDTAARWACDEFGDRYRSATTADAREELVNGVDRWAPMSETVGISDGARALEEAAEGSADAWKNAVSAFAKACRDAGWEG